jgi:hypothetical protein
MYPKGCVLSCIRKHVRCKIARLNSETEHETERARVPLIKKLGPGLITGAAERDRASAGHLAGGGGHGAGRDRHVRADVTPGDLAAGGRYLAEAAATLEESCG